MKKVLLCGLLVATACLTGCGDGKVKEQDVEIKIPISPMEQVKSTLNRYAKGEPMGSEVGAFGDLVAKLRTVDAAKADILEKGLEEIKKAPKAQVAAKAKDLLKQLGL
jgi:O-phosphoseryl-tRNA(Cys) synthetase